MAPSCITAVLAITRFSMIRFPFSRIKIRTALLFFVVYLLYTFTVYAIVIFDKSAVYKHHLGLVLNPYYFAGTRDTAPNDIRVLLFCIWPLLFAQLLSLVASWFTVSHLYKTDKHKKESQSQINSKRVSMKILVTNISGVILTAAAGI